MLRHPTERFGRVLVVLKFLSHFLRRFLIAKPIRNVSRVTQRATEKSFQDVRVQILGLPAANRLNEVFVVVFGAGPTFDLFALFVVGSSAGIVRHQHMTAFAMNDGRGAAGMLWREFVHVFGPGLFW